MPFTQQKCFTALGVAPKSKSATSKGACRDSPAGIPPVLSVHSVVQRAVVLLSVFSLAQLLVVLPQPAD